jgi:glycosyltransferase involved in cell wall biosynthesis
LPPSIAVDATLARGRWRLPYRVLGLTRTLALHDRIVARRLDRLGDAFDVVHVWPLAARETLQVASRIGVTTVLERPNAHTRFAYEVVQRECDRLGVQLPPAYEHAYNAEHLRIEEEEYRLADFLLCPSTFVAETFVEQGFSPEKLIRHTYGYDNGAFFPPSRPRTPGKGITMLFAGLAAVRKGLHFALEAWTRSPASSSGTFLIAGDFLPAYADRLSHLLSHRSVRVLGHRSDVADLMRRADVFVLPTLEEGLAIACMEALATGCVPLVSSVCTDVCIDGENALIHPAGDVDMLTNHISSVDRDRALLRRLSDGGIRTASGHTWRDAGVALVDGYGEALDRSQSTLRRSA